MIGTHLFEKLSHRGRIELEDSECLARRQEVVDTFVVEIEVFEDEIDAPVPLDIDERIIEDVEVSKPQKVHLDEPEFFAGRIIELRNDLTVIVTHHERHDVGQRSVRHNDTCRVNTGVSLDVFKPESCLEHRFGVSRFLDYLAELRRFLEAGVGGVIHLAQRHVTASHHRRNRFGQLFAHPVGEAHHARSVLQRLFRFDDVERRDLRDAVRAILAGHITFHVVTSSSGKVDIEVRHRLTFGVQEPLKEQPVFNRVEVGDSHRESGERASTRTSTWTDANTVFAGPFHKVRNDEVVARKSLVDDHLDLVLRALLDFRCQPVRVTKGEPRNHFALEGRRFGIPRLDGELRHVAHGCVEFDVAPLGNEQRVVGGFRVVRKQRAHLGR